MRRRRRSGCSRNGCRDRPSRANTRSHRGELLESPCRWQRREEVGRDVQAGRRLARIDERNCGRHRDGLGHASRGQGQVDGAFLTQKNLDVFSRSWPETVQISRHLVPGARRHRAKVIKAFGIADDRPHPLQVRPRQRHHHARQDAPGGIHEAYRRRRRSSLGLTLQRPRPEPIRQPQQRVAFSSSTSRPPELGGWR